MDSVGSIMDGIPIVSPWLGCGGPTVVGFLQPHHRWILLAPSWMESQWPHCGWVLVVPLWLGSYSLIMDGIPIAPSWMGSQLSHHGWILMVSPWLDSGGPTTDGFRWPHRGWILTFSHLQPPQEEPPGPPPTPMSPRSQTHGRSWGCATVPHGS